MDAVLDSCKGEAALGTGLNHRLRIIHLDFEAGEVRSRPIGLPQEIDPIGADHKILGGSDDFERGRHPVHDEGNLNRSRVLDPIERDDIDEMFTVRENV